MNILPVIGAFFITLALLSYGIGSISIQRFKLLTSGVLIFFTLGVVLDLLAVSFMIIGSRNSPFSLHGIVGYLATFTMIIDLFLIWRTFFKSGFGSVIKKQVITYTKVAYVWWIIAYLTGSVLVIWN